MMRPFWPGMLAFACGAGLLALASSASADTGAYAKGVETRVRLRSDTTALGQAIRYPDARHPEVTALEVVIPPGGETGWHRHAFPGYAYVLAGELALDGADGRTKTFFAGEYILESVGVSHNGRNPGTVPTRLLAFFTGAKGRPLAEKTASPFAGKAVARTAGSNAANADAGGGKEASEPVNPGMPAASGAR